MKIVGWQKALILWFQGKVEILEYHSIFARSARQHFQLPSVLRLKAYVRPQKFSAIRFCRENVYLRDNFTCQYCGYQHAPRLLTLDHVVPASKKGPKIWTNVVTACRTCNQRKGNRTPTTANMPLLREPTAPTWLPSPDLDYNASMPGSWSQYLELETG